MGVRIGRTPSSGKKRGCWAKSSFALLVPVTALALMANGCPAKEKTGGPSLRDQYSWCVGSDRTKATQDRCQVKVFGQTFGESDHRWLCDLMGNRKCAKNRRL